MPRKDLIRNRELLIRAATSAFVAQGVQVSLDDIAGAAGVGPSTLYRHFPTRDDLVEAVLDQLVDGTLVKSRGADAIADPRASFRWVFAEICNLSGPEIAAFSRLAGTSERTEQYARTIVLSVIGPAAERLRHAGGLRKGVSGDDLVALVRMVESTPSTPAQRTMALEILLDGLIT